MIKQKRIDLDSYKYISLLLGQLIEPDINTEEKITGYIESFGIDNFLKNIEMMDLPYDILEKLESLEQIIEVLEEKALIENKKGSDI